MSRLKRGSALLPGILLLMSSGCNLGFTDDVASTQQRNECDDRSQCSGGLCIGGICRSQSTELGALALVVTPAAGTPIIAGVGFTSTVENLAFERYDIELGHVSRLQGQVRGAKIEESHCVVDDNIAKGVASGDGSLAARLTLTPRTRLLGIANPPRTVEVADQDGGSYDLDLAVPPGQYDLYVEPKATDGGCVRPPYLILDQDIPSGDVELSIKVPEPKVLNVKVRYPGGGGDLRGWTIEIIERDSGRRLSNLAVLQQGEQTGGILEYSAKVAFSEVNGTEATPASELVRLSPPADTVGPQVYVERSVVELFQDGDGLIDQLTELPRPVTFSARVAREDASVSVPANVLFLAKSLASTGLGTVAAFSSSVETEEDGLFKVQLLPGTYRVIVEPDDENLSPVQSEVTVGDAEIQAGKTITVGARRVVSGRLVDFSSSPLSGVPLVATARPTQTTVSVLAIAEGRQVFSPGATSIATGSDGRFALLADPGLFQLTARPHQSSGFPWLVRLAMTVGDDAASLGKLRVSLPVVISGTLTSQDIGDVVPEALIVAYAMLKDGQVVTQADDAQQVLPVAESRVDASGHFQLLLPSELQ